MGKTQVKGDLATAQAIATFTRHGMNVAVPLTESAQYDLIVESDGKLWRVQVKYCGSKDNELSLKRIHSNSQGYVVKYYDRGFDWLYVFRSDGSEFLFDIDLSGRSCINVTQERDLLVNKLEAAIEAASGEYR